MHSANMTPEEQARGRKCTPTQRGKGKAGSLKALAWCALCKEEKIEAARYWRPVFKDLDGLWKLPASDNTTWLVEVEVHTVRDGQELTALDLWCCSSCYQARTSFATHHKATRNASRAGSKRACEGDSPVGPDTRGVRAKASALQHQLALTVEELRLEALQKEKAVQARQPLSFIVWCCVCLVL